MDTNKLICQAVVKSGKHKAEETAIKCTYKNTKIEEKDFKNMEVWK